MSTRMRGVRGEDRRKWAVYGLDLPVTNFIKKKSEFYVNFDDLPCDKS